MLNSKFKSKKFKPLTIVIIGLIVAVTFISISPSSAQTSGRFLYCSSPTQTPTSPPNPTLTESPTPTQTPIPSLTPTPTSSLANSCVVGNSTINKGEGTCDEKTDTVTLCEGNNQMVQKPNFCGAGQVCRSTAGSYQVKCDATCQLKLGSGDKLKADLVVLSEDYDSYNDFLSSLDKAVNAINRTNLGSTRLSKINLWGLLDLNQTYFLGFNCPTAGGLVVACWDHNKAFAAASSKCGGDTYMVINNDTHRVGSVAGIAIWGGTYIYRFGLDYPTVPHELGHSMAGLVDEYSFGIAAPPGAIAGINCSDSGSSGQTTPCPKWATKFPNVGCYKRCGFTDFYRPAQRSIMDRGGSGAVYDFNEPSLVDGWDEVLKLFP